MNATADCCPKCGALVLRASVLIPLSFYGQNPPRQREEYVLRTKWQCVRVEAHRGHYEQAQSGR
jgi:hypothetical protein